MKRGPPSQGWFDDHADIQKLVDDLSLLQKSTRHGTNYCVSRSITNDRADPLARLQQTHHFQAANGVSDGAATDTEPPYQLTLRRKHIARLEFVDDVSLELFGDLRVNPVSRDRFQARLGWYASTQDNWSDD